MIKKFDITLHCDKSWCDGVNGCIDFWDCEWSAEFALVVSTCNILNSNIG